MPDRKESAVGLALSREYALISWFTADLKDPVTCSTGKDEEPELIPVPTQVAALLFDEKECADPADLLSLMKGSFYGQINDRLRPR